MLREPRHHGAMGFLLGTTHTAAFWNISKSYRLSLLSLKNGFVKANETVAVQCLIRIRRGQGRTPIRIYIRTQAHTRNRQLTRFNSAHVSIRAK